MTARFEAEPFGTQGLYHIVRHDSMGKHYLRRFGSRLLLTLTEPAAEVMTRSLEHRDAFPTDRWIVEGTVYQGGHQYPSMLAAMIAK